MPFRILTCDFARHLYPVARLRWAAMDPQQKRDEQHFRQVEKALLHVDDAARQIGRAADGLTGDAAIRT